MAEAPPSASSQRGSEDLASEPEWLTLPSSGEGPQRALQLAGLAEVTRCPSSDFREGLGRRLMLWGHLARIAVFSVRNVFAPHPPTPHRAACGILVP